MLDLNDGVTMRDMAYGEYKLRFWQRWMLLSCQQMPVSWIGRRLALWLRKLVLLARNAPIDAVAEGFRLRVHVRDNVSERKYLFMPQFCDPAERAYLVRHLSLDGVFLDIGANAGIYTLTAARAYAAGHGSGQVIAVEPNPVMQARLQTNLRFNQLESRVIVAPLALAASSGEVMLAINQHNLGESRCSETDGLRVPALSLLDLLAAHAVTRLDGMKIDVEGMEDEILLPFLAHAPDVLLPRFIIIEDSTRRWKHDLLAALLQHGYLVVGRFKMNIVLSLPDQHKNMVENSTLMDIKNQVR